MKKIKFKKKILLIVLIIVLFFWGSVFLYLKIDDYNNKKFISKIEDIKQEKIINLIVEINPSILLKVKNNIVIDSKCLNQDCEELLKKINYTYDDNINNQDVSKIIDIIYSESKEYGFDTSNGINISSSSSEAIILIDDIKEINFKKITFEEESNILNNNGYIIKEELSHQEYNNIMLNELRKDSDYGELYTCDIYDGEVKCYMVNFMDEIMQEFGKQSILGKIEELEATVFKFRSLLKKFDIDYKLSIDQTIKSITLANGVTFDYTDQCVHDINNYENELIDRISITNCLEYKKYSEGLDGELLEDKNYLLPFTKVDLLTKTYDKKDIILIDTTKEPIVLYGIEEDFK